MGCEALMWQVSPEAKFKIWMWLLGRRIDFKIKKVLLDGKWIKLQIWDTAGQERFRTITSAYYRGAMGILLVYDVSDVNSFTNIRNWMKNIEQHASTNVVKALVGNKCDLKESERAVSYSQGKSLAEEYGIPFFETSAKTGEQVQEVFTGLAKEIYMKIKDQALDSQNNNRISIGPPRRHLTSATKRSCC